VAAVDVVERMGGPDAITRVLDCAVSAAAAAGQSILELRETGRADLSYKDGAEPVSRADLVAHEIITRMIRDSFPEHQVLSEETPEVRRPRLSGSGPLWVETFFGWHFLSGPLRPDVRPQVYDLGIEVNFAKQINEIFALHLQLPPMFSTDFANKTGDAFRIPFGGLVTCQVDPEVKLVAGLTYLDRPDLNVLPIAGLRWRPREDLEFDLLVPRPRAAWICSHDTQGTEGWLYLAGEVGGGSWAVKTEDRKTRMGYRDLRLLVGYETRTLDGNRGTLEAGYVFDRRLDFARGRGDQNLGGTAVLRWGRTY
jgi:hypothetical protein